MGEISLIQAFIYLLAAVVCVPIAKRLGLGSVLGYLLAGILIGPFVLGKIIGTSSGDEVKDIMNAAEFGVVMMLFLVGLELDPKEFWRMRHRIIGMGSIQLLGTMALIVPISYYFISPNLSMAIAIASAVAMSSTAIILQTLSEKGLTKTACGQASFSVLLFQDLMVIPILAILPLLAMQSTIISGGSEVSLLEGAPGWMKTLAIISAIGLIFFVGNYIVTPFFKYIARLQVRELFTSFALMLVIGVSILMSYVGLSPALGAFMAGLTLANSAYKHQLESDLEPFKALLLGLFFISVGSTINFRLIGQEPMTILWMTLGFLLVKSVVLFLVGWIYKLKLTQNILFVLLLSQIGEFAFVILNLSSQLQLIPKPWVDLLFATTALTMAITPILLLINEKWIIPLMGMQKVKAGGLEDDLSHDFGDNIGQKVIIAGYGDFGNTVGRIVKYNGFNVMALDKDAERVELLRKLGFQVHFGDATQLNTLQAVKADEADILIASMETFSENKLLIDLVKEHFPHLKIFVRANNKYEAYQFLNRGEKRVYRENFYTAVQVGVDALESLGMSRETAIRQGRVFTVADRRSLRKLSQHSLNLEEYISVSKEELQQVNRMLKEGLDLEDFEKNEGDEILR